MSDARTRRWSRDEWQPTPPPARNPIVVAIRVGLLVAALAIAALLFAGALEVW